MHANVYANGLVYKRARVSACVCASWVSDIHSHVSFLFPRAYLIIRLYIRKNEQTNMARMDAPSGPFRVRSRRLSDTRKQDSRPRVRERLGTMLTRSRGTPSVPPSEACAGVLGRGRGGGVAGWRSPEEGRRGFQNGNGGDLCRCDF